MKNPSREEIERLKEEYPEGCTVELIEMNDPYHPVPSGTRGKVIDVDDIRTCPICKKEYKERPALSRVDSKTEICSECGTRQALELVGKTTKEINEVVELIKKATNG